MPRSYPPEFRRKVLDLLAAGRSVTEVAEDLGIRVAPVSTTGASKIASTTVNSRV